MVSNYPFLTAKERDIETGLDYFLARYYSSSQGRFTSPHEFTGGPNELYNFSDDAADNPTFYAELTNPQSLNKYQHTYNNPLNLVDPDGHSPNCPYDPQAPKRIVDSLLSLGSKALDVVQTGQSVAGLVPGAGDAVEAVNIPIDVARGDYASAAIDTAAVATGPVFSSVAVGNRLRRLGKLAQSSDEVGETVGDLRKAGKKSVSENVVMDRFMVQWAWTRKETLFLLMEQVTEFPLQPTMSSARPIHPPAHTQADEQRLSEFKFK